MWDNLIQSYEGDTKVKSAKLQTFIIQYETLKMNDDESIAEFFLRVDDNFNSIKNLGDEIKYATIVENTLISLTPKFDSKISSIEEKQYLKSLTIEQLHGILTNFEMRKGGPSYMSEVALKVTHKGKEK